VLPFWQAVQSVTEKADQLSPFIWSDTIEKDGREQEKRGQDELDRNIDEGYESGGPEYKTIHQSKQWTSERIQKIMQKHSEKWLSVKLNISV
jgi:hypothetical protein